MSQSIAKVDWLIPRENKNNGLSRFKLENVLRN